MYLKVCELLMPLGSDIQRFLNMRCVTTTVGIVLALSVLDYCNK
jgi:hypothetical protein